MSLPESPSGGPWTAADGSRLYRFPDWASGYFDVGPTGNVKVFSAPDGSVGIDVMEVVEGLASRDVHAPLLLRFSGVLEHRLGRFRQVFDDVIEEAGYGGAYRLIYPIKVNQQRHLCEEIRDVGASLGFGFEVGAKPELIAALGLTAVAPDMPIICNGFKDREYLELVVLATRLGRSITPVIERIEELTILLDLVAHHGVCPTIGLRARLGTRGSGRWEHSAGTRGKFGLSTSDIVRMIEMLREADQLDSLQLLHCHIGSQIREIAAVKAAVGELSHLYVELRRLGAPIGAMDMGGGLAVDYDGTRSATDGSSDYDIEEYAADLVYRIRDTCDEAGAPHPDILTESGRAAVAFGSVLVVQVLGTRSMGLDPPGDESRVRPEDPPTGPVPSIRDCFDALDGGDDPVEVFHDASHAWHEAEHLFALGHLSVTERARCEGLYWALCRVLAGRDDVRRSLPQLEELLADQYYCNFSLFQSMPDAWAIEQRFPIAPLHRLNEEPRRRAMLGDITCDSDGRLERFIGHGQPSNVLPVHDIVCTEAGLQPYYLGVFLVGAYQETLGDLHNLFGDTHAVHITTHPDGAWELAEVVEGDTTAEVLAYVQYDPEQIRRDLRREVEAAIRAGTLSMHRAAEFRRFVDRTLRGYTYLHHTVMEASHPSPPPAERKG